MDANQLFRATGIDLERTATQLFGEAVEDFAKGNLDPLIRDVFGITNQPINRNDGSWYATSYAHPVANSNLRPKLNFLFNIEFLFKPEIVKEWPELLKCNFTFMVRSVNRPKVDFEYEEVNNYNFRTKVLKAIKHKELTITFMDDVGNNTHDFFRIMMMIHSPITRRSAIAGTSIADQVAAYSSGNGMLFSSDVATPNDFAHRGAIDTDIGNVIQAIKITQLHMQPKPGSGGLDAAARESSFFFINPRIVSFDLDDLDHSNSDINTFVMQFDYDFMVMSPSTNLKSNSTGVSAMDGAPGEPSPTGIITTGSGDAGSSIYTRILASVGGRAAQRITSNTIGRVLRRVPGLENTADLLGGSVGRAATGLITGSLNINQGLARPSRAVVNDASTFGPDSASISSNGPTYFTIEPQER